jgi:hypothetical protein
MPFLDGRDVRVVIRNLRITAASAIDARRTADAIASSLEGAFVRLRGSAPPEPVRSRRAADRIASRIAEAAADRLRGAL